MLLELVVQPFALSSNCCFVRKYCFSIVLKKTSDLFVWFLLVGWMDGWMDVTRNTLD
jgi:hypothetical protein